MTDKTLAIFGAGIGLGVSLAKRFGNEGYRIALISRNPASLQERVADLSLCGIEAFGLPADLTKLDTLPDLIRSIEKTLGSIDVPVYAPMPLGLTSTSAVRLDAAKLLRFANIFTFAPIELVHLMLAGMLNRGKGAIVTVGGIPAVTPIKGISGLGPAMAATRNFIAGLHGEIKELGIYAGMVFLGGVIDGSAALRHEKAHGELPSGFPILNRGDIAAEIWTMIAERSCVELILPRV